MEKHTRSDFGYMEGKQGDDYFAQCKGCRFLTNGNRCTILLEEVSLEGACNYFDTIVPSLNKENSGYVERPVRCENCRYFEPEQGHCHMYEEFNEEFPDLMELDHMVSSYGCCNAQKEITPEFKTDNSPDEGDEENGEGEDDQEPSAVLGNELPEPNIKIWIVRHGETDLNAKGNIKGWMNVPLDEEGKRQGKLVSSFVDTLDLAGVYTSDLVRSYSMLDTSKYKDQVKKLFGLRPMTFGALEGKSYDEIDPILKDLAEKWEDDPDAKYDAKSDSFRQFYDRLILTFTNIVSKHKAGDEILIITHCRDVTLLLAWASQVEGGKLSVEDFDIEGMNNVFVDTGSISKIATDGSQYQIQMVNETGHLD